MKKFKSNLFRIQRVYQQQLRIAELEVVKAHKQVNVSTEIINGHMSDIARMQQSFSQTATHGTETIKVGMLRTLQARLALKKEECLKQQEAHQVFVKLLHESQTAYQTLDARLNGLDEFLNKQKKSHQRNTESAIQNELEDVVRMRGSLR